jgi:DNA-binding SARP family transcriptional activator
MRGTRYWLLGSVAVTSGDQLLTFPSTMMRGLLATLLAEPGRIVPTYRLIETLWDEPPASAEANLRGYVTRLRRTLETASDSQLITRRGGGGGYGLAIDGDECDLSAFRQRMAAGRRLLAANDVQGAATVMRQAVDLWRGPAGDDLPDTWPLRTFAAGLNVERLTAVEELAATELRLNEGMAVATDLTALVVAEPMRERAWALLARAQHLTSGPAAALETIAHARSVLNSALGPHRQLHLDRAAEAISLRDRRPTA